jgi:hypothetical protein
MAGGGTAFGLSVAGPAEGEAKKKRKKRCKKTLKICNGKKQCCSKRCCRNTAGTLKFCGPKKSTCCPDGGACRKNYPVCCDTETGPFGCTTRDYPVCCFANEIVDHDYTCAVGYTCCDSGTGCCAVTNSASGRASSSPVGVLAERENAA